MNRRWLRRSKFFGPGTIVAIIATVAIAASRLPNRAPHRQYGDLILEADAHGNLRPVSALSVAKNSLPPLWKPEPELLLQRSQVLRLNAIQQQRIGALCAEWERDKARLESEMNSEIASAHANSGSETASSAGASNIGQNLQGYSALSRAFDSCRSSYWARGTALLNTNQRAAVDSPTFRRSEVVRP